jgi:hypothetical protein
MCADEAGGAGDKNANIWIEFDQSDLARYRPAVHFACSA